LTLENLQPLSDARSFGHEGICKILEARGGIDPVSHFLCIYAVLIYVKETDLMLYIYIYPSYAFLSAFLLRSLVYLAKIFRLTQMRNITLRVIFRIFLTN
jgi:hypothetical protein